jgi:hypothetical protein
MVCPNCGANNDNTATFCFNCGTRLEKPQEPAQAPAAPTPTGSPTVRFETNELPAIGSPTIRVEPGDAPPAAGSPTIRIEPGELPPIIPPPTFSPPPATPYTTQQFDAPAASPPFTLPSSAPAAPYASPTMGAPGVVPNSTAAIISLVFGIVSWFALPLIGAIVAIVAGHMARGEIRRANGAIGGRGMATAGLVLGYAHIALVLIGGCLFLLFFIGLANSSVSP